MTAVATLTGVRVTEDGLPGGFARVAITLDAPAAEALTFAMATTDGTAGTGQADYQDLNLIRRVTIPQGSDRAEYAVAIRDDGDAVTEDFSVLAFVAEGDARFEGGAPAMVAPVEIVPGEVEGGVLATTAATPLAGPDAFGDAPTIRAYDVTMQEGDGALYYQLRVPVTLSEPAPREIGIAAYLQDVTAGPADANPLRGTTALTIAPGGTGGVLSLPLRRDDLIEGDETFDLVITGASGGALFEGGAPALAARITVRDDDDGDGPTSAGIGAPARPIDGPDATGDGPVLRVQGVADIEATDVDSGNTAARFLVTLSEPAPADIRFEYVAIPVGENPTDGDAVRSPDAAVIEAGRTSTWIEVPTFRDAALEGDETFDLVVYGLRGASLEGGGAVSVARGTLLDDEGGGPSGPGGLGEPGQGYGPAPGLGPVAVSTEVREGDGDAYVFVLFDAPLEEAVSLSWSMVAGSAGPDDYDARGGFVSVPAGGRSAALEIGIRDDDDSLREGVESFAVEIEARRLSDFTGEDVQTLTATVTILPDDDGAGASAGPDWASVGPGDPGPGDGGGDASEGADRLIGGPGADELDGRAGDDVIAGGGGGDVLTGGPGADVFAFRAGDAPGAARIVDFGPGDRIALDDQFFGLGGAGIEPRPLDPELALLGIRLGAIGFDAQTGTATIDRDLARGPGEPEAIFVLEGGSRITLDDVLLF